MYLRGRSGLYYFNHFTALVDPAVRTRPVGADLHVAIRALSQLGRFQRIVRPPR